MTDVPEYDAYIPLGPRLLCVPDPLVLAHGSVIRPETIYQRACSGTVVAISDELPHEERRTLVIGDHIAWTEHAGVELRVKGATYYLLDIDEPRGRV